MLTMYPTTPDDYLTRILPTLTNDHLVAQRDTCIAEHQYENCIKCRFEMKQPNRCWLDLHNPDYVDFLQTYFPELII